jgi:hypothetical protein
MYDGLTGSKSSYYGITNGEMVSSSDPRNDEDSYNVNYIYDNFDWDHCEGDDTSDINGLLEALYIQYEIVSGLIEVDESTDPVAYAWKEVEKRQEARYAAKKEHESKTSSAAVTKSGTGEGKKVKKTSSKVQKGKSKSNRALKSSNKKGKKEIRPKMKMPAKKLSAIDTKGRKYVKPEVEKMTEANRKADVVMALERLETSKKILTQTLKLSKPYNSEKMVKSNHHTGMRYAKTKSHGSGPVKPVTDSAKTKSSSGPVKPVTDDHKQSSGPVKPTGN